MRKNKALSGFETEPHLLFLLKQAVYLPKIYPDSIRDFIAFPKNNSGRDTMIDAPSTIDSKQIRDLGIEVL